MQVGLRIQCGFFNCIFDNKRIESDVKLYQGLIVGQLCDIIWTALLIVEYYSLAMRAGLLYNNSLINQNLTEELWEVVRNT